MLAIIGIIKFCKVHTILKLFTNVQILENIFQGYYRNLETKIKHMLGNGINAHPERLLWKLNSLCILQNKIKQAGFNATDQQMSGIDQP